MDRINVRQIKGLFVQDGQYSQKCLGDKTTVLEESSAAGFSFMLLLNAPTVLALKDFTGRLIIILKGGLNIETTFQSTEE